MEEKKEEVNEREHAEHAAEVHEGRLEQDVVVEEDKMVG